VTAIDALNATGRYTASKAAITPAIAKIANAWNQGAYPIATFRDAKGDERFVVWRGLADFEIRYNRTMGLKAKAAAEDTRKLPVSASSSPAAVVYSTGYMWPVKQLREHLREHGYSRKQIEGMTDAECGRAHDRIHGWY
jgi:hypothetical protein